MHFYYWSFLNWIPITIFYVIAAVVLWILWRLIKDDKKAKFFIWGLIPVMLILPWIEELWIAGQFGRHCKQDAGIFIYKTLEVDGFYDATRPTHANPRSKAAADDLDKGGYQFYEMPLPDFKGGPTRVVHLEKENNIWTPTVLEQPTARYHYKWPEMNSTVSYKVRKTERLVSDSETGEVLGRYVDYDRTAPWFFVGSDRPLMFCKEAEVAARERGTVFGPRMVLRPMP